MHTNNLSTGEIKAANKINQRMQFSIMYKIELLASLQEQL